MTARTNRGAYSSASHPIIVDVDDEEQEDTPLIFMKTRARTAKKNDVVDQQGQPLCTENHSTDTMADKHSGAENSQIKHPSDATHQPSALSPDPNLDAPSDTANENSRSRIRVEASNWFV